MDSSSEKMYPSIKNKREDQPIVKKRVLSRVLVFLNEEFDRLHVWSYSTIQQNYLTENQCKPIFYIAGRTLRKDIYLRYCQVSEETPLHRGNSSVT